MYVCVYIILCDSMILSLVSEAFDLRVWGASVLLTLRRHPARQHNLRIQRGTMRNLVVAMTLVSLAFRFPVRLHYEWGETLPVRVSSSPGSCEKP